MSVKISIDKKTLDRRNDLWSKYGKVTNGRRENLGTFDWRVYNMGLEEFEKSEIFKLTIKQNRIL